MQNQNLQPSIKPKFSIWSKLKFWMVTSSILGLGSLNFATLTNDGIHTVAYGTLHNMLAVAGDLLTRVGLEASNIADQVTANSPTKVRESDVAKVTTKLTATNHQLTKSFDDEIRMSQKFKSDFDTEKEQHRLLQAEHHNLSSKHKNLTNDYAALDARHVALAKSHQQLTKASTDRQHKVRSISQRMAPRVGGIATKSLASLPGRAAPYLGTAASVVFTAWELSELCSLMNDLDELNIAFENNFSDPSKVCGLPRPTTFGLF